MWCMEKKVVLTKFYLQNNLKDGRVWSILLDYQQWIMEIL